MIRNALPLTVLAFLASGCSMAGITGIWMVEMTPFVQNDGCEDLQVDHNFDDAAVPEEPVDDEWTEEEEFEGSPGILFAHLFKSAGADDMTMVLDDRVYLGTKQGSGWLFRWEGQEDSSEKIEHEAGYAYTEGLSGTHVEEALLAFSGNTFSGDMTVEWSTTAYWDETDEWDSSEVGVFGGDIPSGNYLVDANDSAVWNTADDAECLEEVCHLAVTQACGGSTTLSGRQTSYDDHGFDGVNDAGQPVGLGN